MQCSLLTVKRLRMVAKLSSTKSSIPLRSCLLFLIFLFLSKLYFPLYIVFIFMAIVFNKPYFLNKL